MIEVHKDSKFAQPKNILKIFESISQNLLLFKRFSNESNNFVTIFFAMGTSFNIVLNTSNQQENETNQYQSATLNG